MIGAEVYLWGTRIGTVTQENSVDVPKFKYDDNFLTLPTDKSGGFFLAATCVAGQSVSGSPY